VATPNPDRSEPGRVQILVADDDAWIRGTIATVLERRGYRVDVVGDGLSALAMAGVRPPDLVITDVVMPVMNGWELVKALRAQPALADVPVILLTAMSSVEDRIRGFRLGADDYIIKPFRFEELDLRVARTLARTRALVPETQGHLHGVGLRGDLEQVGLAGLLALIEIERKSGRLTLHGGDGRCAHLLARDGRIIQAAIDGDDVAEDLDCVHRTLAWSAGEFEFVVCAVEGADRLQRSITHLLLEGAQRMDEARRMG